MTNLRNFAARSFFSVASTAALGLATFAFVMPAHAATLDNDAAPAMEVKVQDLDLATQQGRDTLAARVKFAVAQVCADQATMSDPVHGRIAYDQCRKEAFQQANQRVAAVLGARKLAQR
jgi:UrcA family protein